MWIFQRVREAQHVVALAASSTAKWPDKEDTRECLQRKAITKADNKEVPIAIAAPQNQ